MPKIVPSPVPSGGAIALAISGAVSGLATLSRMASGSSLVQIYSGAALSYFLDIGDGTPAPLASGTPYQYQYTDVDGTATTNFIVPSSIVVENFDPLTEIFIRLIQGGISSLTLPSGVKTAQVTQAMPLGGSIPMPLVVVNMDLADQDKIPIGQSTTALNSLLTGVGVPAAGYITTGFAKRTYRISVLSVNAPERNFYRDTVVGIFLSIMGTVLQPLGLDVTHKWMVSSGQVAADRQAMMPGFYFAEILLDFTGTFNVVSNPGYQTILGIDGYVSGMVGDPPSTPPSIDTITVPLL
jgi:hypothetical protein